MAANDGDHAITNSGIPGVMYPAGSGAQGSTGAERGPAGDEFGAVHVSWGFDSSQPGTGYDVVQGLKSTNADSNPLRDPVSGMVTPTSVAGTVITPHHPNAGH